MKENNLTLEEKIAKIERETAWFEGDDFVLEKAIEKYYCFSCRGRKGTD